MDVRNRGDRRVHAVNRLDGVEVVRYDQESEWYLEPGPESLQPRQRIRFREAAQYACFVVCEGRGEVFLGLYGGARFDAQFKKLCKSWSGWRAKVGKA